MARDALRADVQATIRTHQLFAPGARMLVGVSGGGDSVALLRILVLLRPTWRLGLRAVHVDHGLRPESPQDAAFVESLGRRWDVPVTVVQREVAAACARQGWSLEDGARRIRYAAFCETAEAAGVQVVALAHTADDQAETVLMRLVRGTGLLGLGAMPIRRPLEDRWIVRPLLERWREELLQFLREEHLQWREDATNKDPRFLRNRIRHQLLPLLARDYNPNIKQALVQLAQQSLADYAYLQDAAGRQWRRIAKPMKTQAAPAGAVRAWTVSLSVSRFLHQPKAVQRQLMRQAIQRVRGDVGRLEFRHWIQAERLFQEPRAGSLDLPGGVQLRRESDRVICEVLGPQRAPAESARLRLSRPPSTLA